MSRTRLALLAAVALALALAVPALAASPLTPFVLTKTCAGPVCFVDSSPLAAIPAGTEIDYLGPVRSSRAEQPGGQQPGIAPGHSLPAAPAPSSKAPERWPGFHATVAVTSTDFVHFTWTGTYRQ